MCMRYPGVFEDSVAAWGDGAAKAAASRAEQQKRKAPPRRRRRLPRRSAADGGHVARRAGRCAGGCATWPDAGALSRRRNVSWRRKLMSPREPDRRRATRSESVGAASKRRFEPETIANMRSVHDAARRRRARGSVVANSEPLLERSEQLAVLASDLGRCCRVGGAGRIVLIAGEAGIGKVRACRRVL